MARKIFLVDDEAVIRKAITQSLAQVKCELRSFADGEECLKALSESHCDLLITDINMPGMGGLELIEKARSGAPVLPVIAITGFGDVQMAVSAMKAGAVDFIEKPLDESKFMSAVKRALRIGPKGGEDPVVASLTNAERKVIAYVAAGKTNKEIGEILNRSVRTIENHRHRLSKKLGVNSTAELVRIALRIGLVQSENQSPDS